MTKLRVLGLDYVDHGGDPVDLEYLELLEIDADFDDDQDIVRRWYSVKTSLDGEQDENLGWEPKIVFSVNTTWKGKHVEVRENNFSKTIVFEDTISHPYWDNDFGTTLLVFGVRQEETNDE